MFFKKQIFYTIILASTIFFNYSCNTTEPVDDVKPGRRDYVWTVDTLKTDDWFGISDVWGDSPNSIWIVAAGVSAKDCLWFYDGKEWKRYNQILTPSLNTVFGLNSDEVWIGDSYGTFWRNTGNGWNIFKSFTIDGFEMVVITSIWGNSTDNLYAVGGVANYDGSGLKGIIFKYDGTKWNLLDIPDIKVGFHAIKKMSNGKYLISAINLDSGFLEKLFVYDGVNNLKEIYSDYNWPGLYQMNGEVYITINRKIYKCKDDKLELWKEFPGTSYYGTVLGRSEKDFFCAGYEGIMHYNGTDLQVLYPTNLDLVGFLIFEKDVFFSGYNSETGRYLIIRGTLKEE